MQIRRDQDNNSGIFDMNTKQIEATRFNFWFFGITALAILASIILTIVSLLELCSSSCVEGHKYLLYGIKFEYAGLVILTALLTAHLLSWNSRFFFMLAGLLLAGTVGAELFFIYVQKYWIGHWCPVCLGIAACIGFAAAAYAIKHLLNFRTATTQGVNMSLTKNIFFPLSFIVLGLVTALMGITKIDHLQAAQTSLKDKIAFGNPNSAVEVYVFTDWFCPACEMVEPKLERMTPQLEKVAKVYFIDANIHEESMNFTPYNLSFMVYNKPSYFKLRSALQSLAEKTKTPTEEQVAKAVQAQGVTLQNLSYMDIALGTKLFTKLKKQFEVSSTPTIVVINPDTKKGKKLKGTSDITEANVLKAVDGLK